MSASTTHAVAPARPRPAAGGTAWVVPLSAVGAADLPRVGGKGANLGVLAAAGLPVPPGFCVTTAAFDRFLAQDPGIAPRLDALDGLDPDDVDGVRTHAARLRDHLGGLPVPPEVRDAVLAAARAAGPEHAHAVRSSATLEDLPHASFAGQQDTYLEVRGAEDIVLRVRDCWASLFTDRAVLYRRQHGYPSRAARLAVVVQRMLAPELSGILFTADPVTGHRGVCSIDASYGLGEALVSGLVDADLYRLSKATGAVLEARVGAKTIAIVARPEGGTETRPVPAADRARRCLSSEQLAALLELGRCVEALQGCPQDLEWCIEHGVLHLLQARAITSLFPLPRPVSPDGGLRVYMSFGHVQVNTAPMRPMAHDVIRRLAPFARVSPGQPSELVASAGGRIYVDLTPALLRWPLSRVLPMGLMKIDPGIARRLLVVRDRPAFHEDRARRGASRRVLGRLAWVVVPGLLRRLWWARPGQARVDFEQALEASQREHAERIERAEPGAARLHEAARMIGSLAFERLFPLMVPIVLAGVISWALVGRLVRGRVPETTVSALSRGLPGNVTTDMDLELGDLADRAREIPALVEHLRAAPPAQAIAGARAIAGAEPFLAEWDRFVARYGHRGPGEIDVTVARWADDPSSLVTGLVGMLGDEPGAHRRRHRAAMREREAAEAAIVAAAGGGPLGWLRRGLVRFTIPRVREYLSLREHGKFLAMRVFMQVHRAVAEAAALAVARGRLDGVDDGWMLTVDELAAVVEGHGPDLRAEIARRREALQRHARLVPPRVVTSEGEQPLLPDLHGPLAPGELAGLAASAGVVEGVARVVLDPRRQVLEAGEILVAPFTDPGWTPLFVHAAGLVMEVGGLMTHGSVVAREYGLPAVVGVEGATQRIRTGQRLRVDGDRGRVVLLDPSDPPDRPPAEPEAREAEA